MFSPKLNLLLDKDDKDDIAEDNREVNSDKPSIKHKTNKVSDISRQTQLNELPAINENPIEEPKRQKRNIHFNNDVKVKDSQNHGFTLDKICDDSLRSEMGFTIEEIADPSDNEENPAGVSARFLRVSIHLFLPRTNLT